MNFRSLDLRFGPSRFSRHWCEKCAFETVHDKGVCSCGSRVQSTPVKTPGGMQPLTIKSARLRGVAGLTDKRKAK